MTPVPEERVRELIEGHQSMVDSYARMEATAREIGDVGACAAYAEAGAVSVETVACLNELLAARARVAALDAWECHKCGARFAESVAPVDLIGVRRCSRCVELEAAYGRVAALEREAAAARADGFADARLAAAARLTRMAGDAKNLDAREIYRHAAQAVAALAQPPAAGQAASEVQS